MIKNSASRRSNFNNKSETNEIMLKYMADDPGLSLVCKYCNVWICYVKSFISGFEAIYMAHKCIVGKIEFFGKVCARL